MSRLATTSPRVPTAAAGRPVAVYLQPGQVLVTVEPMHITTILGSCVAVCLRDARSQVSGMNHYLLPRGPRDADSPRFGEVALRMLLDRLFARGATREGLEAKVFGGARILAASTVPRDLGQENVQTACVFLAAEQIRVVAQDTGGTCGRKLVFQTDDGAVWAKSF